MLLKVMLLIVDGYSTSRIFLYYSYNKVGHAVYYCLPTLL